MNEDNPYAAPIVRESVTRSVTLELADLLIFTMISVMSFAWFQKSDPHGLFPEWSFYAAGVLYACLLYTSPSPRDRTRSRMPSSA